MSNKIFIDARSITNEVLDGKNIYARSIIRALIRNKPDNFELTLISDKAHPLVDVVIQANWHLDVASIVDKTQGAYFFSPLSYITPCLIKNGHSLVVVHDLISINQPALVPLKALIIENIFLRLLYFKKNLSFICVSETTEKLLKKFRNFQQNIISSTIGVELELPSKVSKEDYLLCFQAMTRRKNQIMILQALRQIKPNLRPNLILAGSYDKDYLKKIELFIKGNNLSDTVKIITNVSDDQKIKLISKANISIFPNLIEGFGIPLIESLKLGTPILTRDIDVFNEINLDQNSRFNTVDQLSDLILKLNDTKFKKLLENQQVNLAKYDYDLIAQNLLSALK